MELDDRRGLRLTGATTEALDLFEQALAELQCYRGDPLATADRALKRAPALAMARFLKGYAGILATERPALEMARAELAATEDLPLNDRERGHAEALRAFVDGRWETGIVRLDAVLADHPRDALALQAAHVACFYAGDARNLRDTVGRVRAAWEPSVPGYHAVLGMHAFGLEECGDYASAEREARAALELEPRDAWAQHALIHVMEMQGRLDEGVALSRSREPHWAVDNFFAIHLWWHLALFHLDRGETPEALRLYDERLRGTGSLVVLDLIDASQLLWRLQLRQRELGERPAALATAWAPLAADGLYAFNDVHAAMAFLLAGRVESLAELLGAMERQLSVARAGGRDAPSNAAMTREVGLPVVQALTAYAGGDYGQAIELLWRVRPIAQRFGGSHAQRDLLDQTLCEAALRAGRRGLAMALARERLALRPGHPQAEMLRTRAAALRPSMVSRAGP